MGKLNVKSSDVSVSKPGVLPQPLYSSNHLVFKPQINNKQLGTISRSHYSKRDLMIFHQNICLFIYILHSIDPN